MITEEKTLQKQQEQSFNPKFFEPVPSTTQEYVKKNIPKPQHERLYAVRDEMTIKQLTHNWFLNNFGNQPESDLSEENYVAMYDTKFPLYKYYTMRKVKKQIGIQAFNKNILIRIYPEWECDYHKDQSCVKYKEYEQENSISIQTPFKIRISLLKNYYFYIETQLKTNLQTLIQEVKQHLKQSSQIQILNNEFKFTIQMKTKQLQKQDITKLNEEYKFSLSYPFNDEVIQLTDKRYSQVKLRQICPPGQVLEIKIQNAQKLLIQKQKQNQKELRDPSITIVYYQKCDLSKTISPIIEKTITKNYQEIKNIKVQTLLYEHDVHDALFTSVSYTDKLTKASILAKPKEKFSKFQEIINQTKQNNLLFITVPENLLYYKQLISLNYEEQQNESIKKLMLKSLDDQKHRQKIEQKKKERKKERGQQIINLGDEIFLYPILMYTSPSALYKNLNAYLRKSSLSLIQTEKISFIGNKQNQWCYPFCQKLIKALLKLPNYQGNLLRGSVGCTYDYKVGEIIQWNSFTSSTKKISQALRFITAQAQKSLPFLFEIEVYSGKDIQKFSCFPHQSQVLILPYTKFKVIDKLELYPYKMGQEGKNVKSIPFYRLLQIPVPKKIPGHIVVWIDKNINQNFKAFSKIIAHNNCIDFDLIQLVSNDHFEIWLNEFKHILSLPQVKVHFISNMNRPPFFQQQGLQTLQIIRRFNKTATLVYYIGDVQKTKGYLQQHWQKTGQEQDKNVEIVRSLNTLNDIFRDKFCKQ